MKLKVFYNDDCNKYGIAKYVKEYGKYKWKQILIFTDKQKFKTYTYYKKTAYKWLEKLKNNIYKEFTYKLKIKNKGGTK